MERKLESFTPHLRAAVEMGFPSSKIDFREGSRPQSISFEGAGYHLPENVSVTIHEPQHPEGFHAKVGYRNARTTHEITVFPDGRVVMPKSGSAMLNMDVLATVQRVHKALEKNQPK